jgi:hypothetical protein
LDTADNNQTKSCHVRGLIKYNCFFKNHAISTLLKKEERVPYSAIPRYVKSFGRPAVRLHAPNWARPITSWCVGPSTLLSPGELTIPSYPTLAAMPSHPHKISFLHPSAFSTRAQSAHLGDAPPPGRPSPLYQAPPRIRSSPPPLHC